LKLLRHKGASLLVSEHGPAKFLLAFADALEVAGQPGVCAGGQAVDGCLPFLRHAIIS
jgi:hypothetical protein